jgi:hypothetical protein
LALLISVSGATGAQSAQDVSLIPFERSGQPLKLTHRATAPDLTTLEEFGIDDGTERHAKIFSGVCRLLSAVSWPERCGTSFYRAPLRPYRCCTAPPTGPPHA